MRIHVLAVPLSAALFGCVRDAHAETPKPLPGGRVFDVELVESEGAVKVTHHYVVTLAGETGCAKLSSQSGKQSVAVQACLHRNEAKTNLDVELVRQSDGDRTKIEGRLPLVVGQKGLVGRAETGSRKLEVSVTAT